MTWSGMGDGFSLFCGFVLFLEMETELEGLFKRKIEVEVEWKRNEILGEQWRKLSLCCWVLMRGQRRCYTFCVAGQIEGKIMCLIERRKEVAERKRRRRWSILKAVVFFFFFFFCVFSCLRKERRFWENSGVERTLSAEFEWRN
jgi:hypothetical protein